MLGTQFLTMLSPRGLLVTLSLAVFAFVLLSVARPAWRISSGTERLLGPVVGFVAGTLGGVTNSPALPLTPYFYAIGLPKAEFVRALSATFIVFKLTQLAAVWQVGLVDRRILLPWVVATLVSLVAFRVGLLAQDRVPQATFNRLVLGFLSVVPSCSPTAGGAPRWTWPGPPATRCGCGSATGRRRARGRRGSRCVSGRGTTTSGSTSPSCRSKPPVLHGERGLSRKSDEPGNASYYYSLTRMRAGGEVRVAGRAFPVEGLAWMDREWSTSALGPDLVGWDWFALQLDDGRELMLYRLRRRDGGIAPASQGTIVLADGATRSLERDAVEVLPLGHWTSPRGGTRYPAGWRLRIPALALELTVTPVLADQELDLGVRYWEGAVRAEGTADGRPLGGEGYVELVGYAPAGGRRRGCATMTAGLGTDRIGTAGLERPDGQPAATRVPRRRGGDRWAGSDSGG